ncbi:MAG: hypothetical protein AAGA03_13925 [Planctomycetota bacterium]
MVSQRYVNWTASSLALMVSVKMACLLCVSGCARSRTSIDQSRSAFAAGQLTQASKCLQECVAVDDGSTPTAELDLAIVEFASGNLRSSEARLRRMRDHFDQMANHHPVQEAVAVVRDDNARVFQPAGYEEVMIRSFLAICSLAGNGDDAESYALQAAMKQSELADEATGRGLIGDANPYQPIALAPYLRGILREATHHDYDDAARAYQLVGHVRPDFLPASADLQRASDGVHSSPGHGVVYVIACVGRGPVLQEGVAETTSTAMTIASALVSSEAADDGSDLVLPNLAEVKVPIVHVPPSDTAAVSVRLEGQLLGATQTLTNVVELAQQQREAEMPWTIARAVVRRASKEAAVAGARNALGLEGNAGQLFQFATATAWAGSEKADLRCWGLLPREIQVLRAELPAGHQTLSLSAVNWQGSELAGGVTVPVNIVDGRNRYVVAFAPHDRVMVVPGGR